MAINGFGRDLLSKVTKSSLARVDTAARNEMISLDLLDENPDNEKVFDMGNIGLLAGDIKARGFSGAIVVFEKPDGRYEISSGHRRFRAAKEAGDTKIRCVVMNLPDDVANGSPEGVEAFKVEQLLLSNLRNRELTVMEKSNALKLYYDKVLSVLHPRLSEAEKAKKASEFSGVSINEVSRLLSLQKIDERLKDYARMPGFPVYAFTRGTVTLSHDQVSLLIDEIETTPGFAAYRDGSDSCPLRSADISSMIREIRDRSALIAEQARKVREAEREAECLADSDDVAPSAAAPYEISMPADLHEPEITSSDAVVVKPSPQEEKVVETPATMEAPASADESRSTDDSDAKMDLARTSAFRNGLRSFLSSVSSKERDDDWRRSFNMMLDEMIAMLRAKKEG